MWRRPPPLPQPLPPSPRPARGTQARALVHAHIYVRGLGQVGALLVPRSASLHSALIGRAQDC